MIDYLSRIPVPEGTDEELVREALKALRRISSRYGFTGYNHKLAGAAIEAFDRLTEPRQMELEERDG